MADKIYVFTPSSRIESLEHMNQVQFETIKLLSEQKRELELKLAHAELLLSNIARLDVKLVTT